MELIDHYDPIIKRLDKQILSLAKGHDPMSLHLLKSIKGVGDVLALTMLYEIHDMNRFPSRGEFCSYARLAKGQKSLAGKNYGTTGGRIGNAYLRWACSEASLLYLRGNQQAETYYNRLISRHGKGKALIPTPRDQAPGSGGVLHVEASRTVQRTQISNQFDDE